MKKFFMMSALFFGMACSTFAADDVTGIRKTGDVNGDGEVNIGDITAVLSVMATGNSEGLKADVNKDDEVNIGDITAILAIMATGSAS